MKPQKFELTQDYVDALTLDPSQPDDVSVYDTLKAGLYVRLRRGANGVSKTYYVRYQRGRDRPYKIGSTSAYMLEDARNKAYKVLRDAEEGKNPKAKGVAASYKTFSEAAEIFIADKQGRVRHNTFRGYPRYLCGPYFQPLHKLELASITHAEFVECIDQTAKELERALHIKHADAQFCSTSLPVKKAGSPALFSIPSETRLIPCPRRTRRRATAR